MRDGKTPKTLLAGGFTLVAALCAPLPLYASAAPFKAVQTGDTQNLSPWILVLVAACMLLAVVLLLRMRKKPDGKPPANPLYKAAPQGAETAGEAMEPGAVQNAAPAASASAPSPAPDEAGAPEDTPAEKIPKKEQNEKEDTEL